MIGTSTGSPDFIKSRNFIKILCDLEMVIVSKCIVIFDP